MNNKEIKKIISEEVSVAFNEDNNYSGKNISVHESDFSDENSWINFTVEGGDSSAQDGTERTLSFIESEFSDWIKETEDVSNYMEKEEDFSPEERTSTPYDSFNYKEWKDYNDLTDYAHDFLIYKIKKEGMPEPAQQF